MATNSPFRFEYFLDRQRLIDEIGRENAKRLARMGGFIRTTARRKLKRRKGAAPPGEPPHVHQDGPGAATLKAIQFALEPGATAVIVGPVRLPSKHHPPGGTIPEVLEYGGDTAPIHNGPPVSLEARPFMEPALNTSLESVSDFWSQ